MNPESTKETDDFEIDEDDFSYNWSVHVRKTGHVIEDMPIKTTVDSIDSNNTEF